MEVEKTAENLSSTLDVGAISWLFSSLGQDQEFEPKEPEGPRVRVRRTRIRRMEEGIE